MSNVNKGILGRVFIVLLSLLGITLGNIYNHAPELVNELALVFVDVWQVLPEGILFTIAGISGFVIYVGSYIALQIEKIDGNSIRYSVANGTAACLVLVSLISDFNLASAMIQLVWILASLFGAIKYYRARSCVDC